MKIGIEDHIDLLVEEGGVAKLQQLAHDPDKATAKYARKGLHILRTRGVDAPVPPKRPQVVLSDGRILGSLAVVGGDIAPRMLPSRGDLMGLVGIDLASPTLPSDAAAALPLLAALPGLIRRRRKVQKP
jgi:hypothetical protein